MIRRLAPGDSFEELTALLHRAYVPLAAQGMRFAATHQSAEVTARRAGEGECWVAEVDGRLAGTCTIVPPGSPGARGWYARPGVAKLAQVGVDPQRKGTGLGRALFDHAERRAAELGATELALDTSVHARALIDTYARRGFRFVEHVDWRPFVNYLSVLLSKRLPDGDPPGPIPCWDRAPAAWNPAILDAFAQVWPGLPGAIAAAGALGYPWSEVSTPFPVWDGDRVTAHVGVIEVPLMLDGRSVAVAGVHAVGTTPTARGRGHGRRAMKAALAHVDARFATAYLTTSIPAYFEPFGFRVVPEHRFRAPVPTGGGPPLTPADPAYVKWALRHRTPVSHRLASCDGGWLFAIDEVIEHGGFGSTYAAEDLGVVVAWRRDGDVATVLDVVGPELPALGDLAARLPADLRLELAFCPDRFRPCAPIPGGSDPTTVLMVRGDWPLEGPVTLPFHARC